jgi:hypothetical protein
LPLITCRQSLLQLMRLISTKHFHRKAGQGDRTALVGRAAQVVRDLVDFESELVEPH